jgi:uncharacterized protein (TIGR02996 family)
MSVLEGLLRSVVDEPGCEANWLVLADWLEENDDPRRAELLRLHRKLLATCCEPEKHPERSRWQGRIVELLAEGVRPCVPQQTVVLRKGVEMPFSFIPPGSFLRGSPKGEEGRLAVEEVRYRVTLPSGFWLGVHPVTQAQWQAVTRKCPSRYRGGARPVEMVSWEDCVAFCRQLGQKTQRRFRLPTELEWESACRAGTTTPFFFGETISTDQANYNGRYIYGYGHPLGVYRGQTTPVDSFPPNAWGLYDLHGNVAQWCRDWDGGNRELAGAEAPVGFAPRLRGGCWDSSPKGCRSASRTRSAFGVRSERIGCRVCLCLD